MKNAYVFFMIILILIPSVGVCGNYSHQEIDNLTEKGLLPDFCPYAGIGRKSDTSMGQHYLNTYGQDWIHMHHFCWALVDSQRGFDGQAIGNLDYVLRNSKSSFKLRPMVLMQKAHVLIQSERYSEAVPVYYELITVKPDSEEGYIGLANVFMKNGDKKTAREIAKQGLIYLPESEKLRALLK